MASRRMYKGSPCTKDCGGHRAGARVCSHSGGTQRRSTSPSFNTRNAALQVAHSNVLRKGNNMENFDEIYAAATPEQQPALLWLRDNPTPSPQELKAYTDSVNSGE